jgi:lysophospholipase L1-like esterase
MTLFFGTNDANALSARRLSLQRYVENVRYILGVITARGIKVVVVGPSAVNEEAPGLVNNDTMRHLAYAEAAKRVAREQGVPFIDLWHAFLAEKGWREGEPIPGRRGSGSEVDLSDLLSDGVHFTGKGYQIWFRELLTVVRVHWPELKSEELKSVLPSIDDLPYRDLPDALWRGVEERP